MAMLAQQYSTYSPGAEPIDLQNLGSLIHTAEMQYQRQLKTLQALHKQAELTAAANAAWQEREARRYDKHAAIDMEREAQRAAAEERQMQAAEHRAARAEAAARHEEAMRAAAAARVQAVEDRVARFAAERAERAAVERERLAAIEARREATYRSNLDLLEGRRRALVERQRRVEDILRQREELRQIQLQIKSEEDSLRDHQRATIKSRAEALAAGRAAEAEARNTAKDEYTERRKQEIEHLRRVRAEELRSRFDAISQQAAEAAAAAEAERQALAGRLAARAARGEALGAQRAALLGEMQSLRQRMAMHEDALRSALQHMRNKGSSALPQEVVASLQGLATGGPLRAMTTLLGPGPGLGTGARGGSPTKQAAALGWGQDTQGASPGQGLIPAGRGLSPQRQQQQQGGARSPRTSPGGVGGGPGSYLTAMLSPRVGQVGPGAGRARRNTRPMSASADFRRSPTTATATSPSASPDVPFGFPPAAVLSSRNRRPATANPYISKGPYATSSLARPRDPAQHDADVQYAERMDASGVADSARVSGRYSGVHVVAAPGSRREEELRGVLQEEIAKEGERQALLAQVTDDAERARLVKLFTMEREEAKRRILALSSAAQAALYH